MQYEKGYNPFGCKTDEDDSIGNWLVRAQELPCRYLSRGSILWQSKPSMVCKDRSIYMVLGSIVGYDYYQVCIAIAPPAIQGKTRKSRSTRGQDGRTFALLCAFTITVKGAEFAEGCHDRFSELDLFPIPIPKQQLWSFRKYPVEPSENLGSDFSTLLRTFVEKTSTEERSPPCVNSNTLFTVLPLDQWLLSPNVAVFFSLKVIRL